MSYKPGKATIAAVTFAFSMTLIPAGPANAGLISTDRIIEQERVTSDRERVASFVAREDVRKEFQKHGVNPDEAAARVAALSDAEIGQIAARLDTLPAGQDAATRDHRRGGDDLHHSAHHRHPLPDQRVQFHTLR